MIVGSLESQVMTQAKRFEALKIETSGKTIDTMPVVDENPRPLTKLARPSRKATTRRKSRPNSALAR